MTIIKDLPVGFDQHVLVKLSGGADSSIVYYAVCDKFKDRNDVKIVVVTLDTDYKNQYIASAKRIIQIVGSLTGKYPIDHMTSIVTHSDENYTRGQDKLVKRARKKYNTARMYSGLTQNPPADAMKQFVDRNYAKFNIDLDMAYQEIDGRDKTRDTAFKMPDNFDPTGIVFRHGDKFLVADAYRYYDMMEKLYPYTFSCETVPYNFKNDIPIHCGQCFFCLERWYAFGRII